MRDQAPRDEYLSLFLNAGDEAVVCAVFAMRLREAMEVAGLDVPDLVSATGFSRATIYNLRGKDGVGMSRTTPTGVHIYRLAKALAVSADYLLGLTDKPDSSES